MRAKRRLVSFLLWLLLALLVAGFAAALYGGIRRGQGSEIAAQASRHLSLGMTRWEAEQAVGAYAKRYRCSDSDLYLFGSSDPNLAGMLVLWYDRQADRDVLRSISGLDIDQFNQFAHCAASGRAQRVAPGRGKGVRS